MQAPSSAGEPLIGQDDHGADGVMPTVYLTSYQGTPVFEALVRNVAVMMRQADLWLNATQILKVAGMPKTQRTKYLEKEVITGLHEKVQGGCSSTSALPGLQMENTKEHGADPPWYILNFQVPYATGVELANRNHVADILLPVFLLQAQAARMPTLPPGVQNAPPSASKRRAAGGKGKSSAAKVDGSSTGGVRAGTADTVTSGRMGGPSINSPFTTMPFQPAPANGTNSKAQPTQRQQAYPQHQHQQHQRQLPQSQSPGDVFVVQTPQGLQGRTLQPTSSGLIPGYGHAHVPQLYHMQGQQQQQQSTINMQSPMGLYTHQSPYPQFPQQQQHPSVMIQPTRQQNGQPISLKRPFPDDSGFHPDQLAGIPQGSMDSKHGAPIYVDQFGRPFRYEDSSNVPSADLANFSMENAPMVDRPAKRIKLGGSQAHDMLAAMAQETGPMTIAEVQALLTHAEGPMDSLAEIADADAENGDDFEIEDDDFAGELPPGTRLASKPQRPISSKDASLATSMKDKNQSQQRARTKLLAIFEASSYDVNTEVDLDSVLASSPRSSPARGNGDTSMESINAHTGIDVDQVIDERGHTALHWAAALAREKLVAQLIARGADINRGNFAGETPLIRAVLAVNNAESTASFHLLLAKHLGNSLRTIDNNHRTVLHHISAVAGINGRSASANTYMSTLLAWMATVETPEEIRECVNFQDVNGDTALNVAARVGNRNLVKLLLDAGADKSKANKLGLRPGDFGVQVEGLDGCPPLTPLARSAHSASLPPEKAQDLTSRLTSMIQDLNDQFTVEISTKQDKLDQVQTQVIETTRELASLRRQLAEENAKSAQLDSVEHKRQNLERAVKQEVAEAWADNSETADLTTVIEISAEDTDPSTDDLTTMDSEERIVFLRRIRVWQKQMEEKLEAKLQSALGLEREKLEEYKKAMASRLKVPVEAIDENMLDQLTKAVSDCPYPDSTSR
ncbi:hypothetical protein QFC22_005418 [Naganishia vaughanmartiniae]|uniref:Uncharacterized protein n=1 Tax=Naganishia vaughanmartiniae TaxID=1424756 RepID=A0ACC2WTK4_9TREE|nr:hypothetical protein QFC22_005418 [Naganishia vaughanmartiniae]